jgi:hypothetical protein
MGLARGGILLIYRNERRFSENHTVASKPGQNTIPLSQ